MKKLAKLLSMALIVAMSAFSVACDDKPEPTEPNTPQTPTDKPNDPATEEPTVSVEAGEVGEDWISFTITTSNVKRAFYVAIEDEMYEIISAEEGFDLTEFVLSSPNMVLEPNTAWTTTFDGRTHSTTYYIYAAAFNGDKKVLSERVEMTTLDKQYTTTALPEATSCDIALTVLSAMDRYTFTLADESENFTFSFNLYTEKGCNGAIPAGTYTIGSVSPGFVELNSMTLKHNGLPIVVDSGSLEVELNGDNISLSGDFTLSSLDKATFEYEGPVTFTGLDSGEGEDDGVIKFTRSELFTTSERGWYEIQFQPATGFSMLDVQFYSDPSKDYLSAGFYPVFTSGSEAAEMGMGNSWVSSASFYQDDMMYPYFVMPGMDSYIQVNSDLSSGSDYYDITFSLKVQSQVDFSVITLNGTYKGALGFTPSEATPQMNMVSFYVDIDSEGTTHTLNFHGGYTTMIATIEGTLPEVGGEMQWYDMTSGKFSDAYATVYDHPIVNGRIAILRYPDAADASDEGKIKPYYAFQVEGVLENVTTTDQETGVSTTLTYDLVGEWTSFQTEYSSEW